MDTNESQFDTLFATPAVMAVPLPIDLLEKKEGDSDTNTEEDDLK